MSTIEDGIRRIPVAACFEPLLKPARYKGAKGGRGGGKSWFFAQQMIKEHICSKTDSVCLREILKSLQFSSKKLLETVIYRLNAGDYFEVQDKVIKAKNGGIIVFAGMQDHTADSIKSLEGFDRAWFEEAQNASQRSIDLLKPTIRKADSELWFSWNTFKEDDPIEELLCSDKRPDDAVVVECNIEDNPWATPELWKTRADDKRLLDPDKFANIWQGKYLKNTEGDYYKHELAMVRQEGRICRIPRLAIPVNTFWDIGRSDGTAIWFHQAVGMEDRFIGYYEAHDQTLAHYVTELQRRGYIYNKHFLPHDANNKPLSVNNLSVKQQLQQLGLRNIEILPKIDKLNLGIQITKKHFPSAYFDADAEGKQKSCEGGNGCKFGMYRLENYRKKYSQHDMRWIDEPNKTNGSSEAADAFRQWAQAKEAGSVTMAGETSYSDEPTWKPLDEDFAY